MEHWKLSADTVTRNFVSVQQLACPVPDVTFCRDAIRLKDSLDELASDEGSVREYGITP